jgi:quercetin dioxygenase-like cupin family protein
MLSKIENAQSTPSLTTLSRLATALSVPITAFFRGLEEERDALHLKSGQGIDIEIDRSRPGRRYQLLGVTRGPNQGLEPILVTLTSGTEVFPLFQHEGTEFIFMLDGVMEYGYGTAHYLLEPGDTLFFEGEVPHGPVRIAELPVRFLSVKAYGEEP